MIITKFIIHDREPKVIILNRTYKYHFDQNKNTIEIFNYPFGTNKSLVTSTNENHITLFKKYRKRYIYDYPEWFI